MRKIILVLALVCALPMVLRAQINNRDTTWPPPFKIIFGVNGPTDGWITYGGNGVTIGGPGLNFFSSGQCVSLSGQACISFDGTHLYFSEAAGAAKQLGVGTVAGPASSAIGDVVLFNNLTGSLLSDRGFGIIGGGLSGVLGITTNGNVSGDYVCWISSVASECVPGLTPVPISASGTTVLLNTYRGEYIKASSTSGSQTFAQPDGTQAGFGNNFYEQICNHSTVGALSITNNGGSFTFNGAASPFSLPEGYCAQVSANSTNTGWAMELSPGLLTAGSNITITQTQYGTTIAASGGSGTVTDGSGTTTANLLPLSTTTAHVLGYSANLSSDSSGDLLVGLSSYTSAITASPLFELNGSYENAATPTYAEDSWTVSNSIGSGLNGTSTLLFNHSGTTGTLKVDLSNAGANKVALQLGPSTSSNANITGVTGIVGASGASGGLFIEPSVNTGVIGLYDSGGGGMITCNSAAVATNDSCAVGQILKLGSGGAWLTSAAPTISSGFGSSPSVVAHNGTATMTINVGTGGTATSGVIGLPTAANGWACFASDQSTPGANFTKQSANSTTTATLTNYNSSGTATAWSASDVLIVHCFGF